MITCSATFAYFPKKIKVNRMSTIDQWKKIETTRPQQQPNGYVFRGLMRNPDYLDSLSEQLKNPFILIELTSKCNFSCYYCNSKNSIRPKGFMDEKLFYRIVDQIEAIFPNSTVALHVDGEPTLHPNFQEFVSYLNAKKIPISLATNSSLLKDSFLALEYDLLTYLSTSAEELKKRSAIDFDKYTETLSNYLQKWKESPTKQNLSLHLYHEAGEDMAGEPIREKLKFMRSLLTRSGFVDVEFRKDACCFYTFRKENGCRLAISFTPIVSGGLFPGKESQDKAGLPTISPEVGFCDSAWLRMTIFWDGSIGLCCHGLQGETIYTAPEEIWEKPLDWLWLQHPHVRFFRESMATGQLVLKGCKKCLTRYPNREFYVQGTQFIPKSRVMVGEYYTIDPTYKNNAYAMFGFVPGISNGIVWSAGRRTQFGFRIDSPEAGCYTLEIEGIGFAPKELGPDQKMSVLANGLRVGELALEHSQLHTYRADFSTKGDAAGVVVTLEFGERKSPFELGLGPDRRRLGIGISRFRVTSADHPSL
jgi:organic radical activating enzyme